MRVIVDVFTLGRMILDYAFFLHPKDILDEAHLLPSRATVLARA
jgi:hypothetical protein